MTDRNQFKKVLEARYGASEAPVNERFGKDYFNGIKGWQFPVAQLRQANQSEQLLTLDLDFPGNRCQIDCVYCFAKVGEKTGTYYRPGEGDKPLTLDEIKLSLREAKQLGLESVKVIGFREPFDNPGFHSFLDFLTELKVHPVVFTSAYTLGEEAFGGDMQKAVDFLAERDVSLMVKFHTLNQEREDQIVQKKGYADIRDRHLRALLDDRRFTNRTPTRLGIENVLCTSDIDELVTIYDYFKIHRNVFIDIDPPIPVGRTGTLEEAQKLGLMPQPELKDLYLRIQKINQQYGIVHEGVSPFFGGPPCSQLPNGLYLTLSGKVLTCCGGNEIIGNVRDSTLKDIFEKNPHKNPKTTYHDCPYRADKGIMTTEFIRDIEKLSKDS